MLIKQLKALIPLSIKKAILKLFQELSRYVSEIPKLHDDFRKIHSSEVNSKTKRKIRRTLLYTFYFKKYNKNDKVANIVGNKISFNYFNTLKGLFSEIFIDQCYWFTTDTESPVIIDCGSNFGQSIIYFKMMYPESKITCFEPDDQTFSFLKHNIESNGIKGVEMHKKAVASHDGTIDFYNIEDNQGSLIMSTIKERVPSGKKNIVEATRLSNYIDRPINFLKMDIEGSELSVLKELVKSDKLQYIKQMVIEYHHHIKEHEDHFSHTLELLEDAGFGYQIETEFSYPRKQVHFQDILIYAYNKNKF